MMEITRDIQMRVERCAKCARWWAVELHVVARCPVCARDAIYALNVQGEDLLEDMRTKDRQIAALRGVISRMKRKTA